MLTICRKRQGGCKGRSFFFSVTRTKKENYGQSGGEVDFWAKGGDCPKTKKQKAQVGPSADVMEFCAPYAPSARRLIICQRMESWSVEESRKASTKANQSLCMSSASFERKKQ